MYIYAYKITSKCHSQTTPFSELRLLVSENVLAPSADNQTRNYDTECSNHHPSLSTLRTKVKGNVFLYLMDHL